MRTPGGITGFVSGKGGVGKTSIVANVAVAAARRGRRVLAVDGDLGLASLDVFLGLKAERTLGHVLAGDCALDEAIVAGPEGIHVLPAAVARPDLSCLSPASLARLLVPLYAKRHEYDLILLDVGPGISPTVVSLALACDRLILVTTPDPTSLADAYATLKVVTHEDRNAQVEVVVNLARNGREARDAHGCLYRVAHRFLKLAPPLLGDLSKDSRFEAAARRQLTVVRAFPTAASARQLVRLSDSLQEMRVRGRPRPALGSAAEV